MKAGSTKVWVTGARGLLGRSLCAQLAAAGIEQITTGREVDVSDEQTVLEFVAREQPTRIINCAAYTRVDDAETEEDAAWACNATGPENVGRAAATIAADVIHFSTDYVFDGRSAIAYDEDAATNPLNAYGRSKLAGEERLLASLESSDASRRVQVLRSSWLFGAPGRCFVTTMLELMRTRRRLEVVADQRGCPTYADDLARAALELSGVTRPSSAPSGIFHFANAGVTSWHGFAEAILAEARSLGFELVTEAIASTSSSASGRAAVRPAHSALGTQRISSWLSAAPRPWREALRQCLRRIREGRS